MGRPKNTYVPGGIYLVSAISKDRQALFADEGDRADLGHLVADVIGRCGAKIHAFKWLEDELLAIVQVYDVSLAGVMQRITSLHARRVHGKLGRRGSLFEHPHRAILLEDRQCVLEALAIIHRAPTSPWSSHFAYLGLAEIPWLSKQMALDLLSTQPGGPIGAYRRLIDSEPPWKHMEPGRVGRSSRTGERRPYDHFAGWLKAQSRARAKPATLDQVIQAVSRWFQVDPAAIESASTSPLLCLARALIVWNAMQNGIASLAELATRFGRVRSTLYEGQESYRARAPQLFSIHLPDILQGPQVALPEIVELLRATRQRTARLP